MKMDKKKKILDVGCIVILIVSLLLLCITNGMSAGTDADFYAVNGDFQNYNVVRRLLDGQTPFKEFAPIWAVDISIWGPWPIFCLDGRG